MAEPAWRRRFRAPVVSVPSWGRDAPDRCLYVSNASGVSELYSWDRASDEHVQLTRRPEGTTIGHVTPDGESVWWFDDTRGDERGVWRVQPFGSPPGDAPPATTIDPGYSTGLAFAAGGAAAVGVAAGGRQRVVIARPDGATVLVHDHHEASGVGGWSHDGDLLVYSHGEHGDNRNRAQRVVTVDGEVVADLWDGPGLGVTTFRWAPVDGDRRVLIAHERRGHRHPAVWDLSTGDVIDLDVDLDGELVVADWYPAGDAVLLVTLARGRSHLFRHEPGAAGTERLPLDIGMVTGVRVRPDGELWWAGSSAATPPAAHCGSRVLRPAAEPAPGGVPYTDLLTVGPGGEIHSFVATPAGDGPFPTVFRVHGGPAGIDADVYTPAVQAWVDHGYAVVLVNYRGSVGYGKAWQDAIIGKPGYRELEDIAAVRDHVVSSGIADPDRVVLHGASWGGYLTLLGLGTQPGLWSLGIAAVPLASLRDHYHQQGETLQAYWRSVFGGTPDTLPYALDDIDPVAHVERVGVPVFVLVGDNDPRCPLPQVLTYVDALAAAGVEHELYRYAAGHGSMVVDEQIDQLARCLAFAARHLGTTPPSE